MDEDFQEFDRKREALQKMLRLLKEEGNDTPSARNDVRASNEVLWEIGAFGEGARSDRKIPDDVLQGLIIRTGQDALAAKLNTAKILDLLSQKAPEDAGSRLLSGLMSWRWR